MGQAAAVEHMAPAEHQEALVLMGLPAQAGLPEALGQLEALVQQELTAHLVQAVVRVRMVPLAPPERPPLPLLREVLAQAVWLVHPEPLPLMP